MTFHAFPLETRWNATNRKHDLGVIAKCAECGRDEWALTRNPGIAPRLFQNKGWRLGSRRNADICPTCAGLRAGAIETNRPAPVNGAMQAALAPLLEAMMAGQETPQAFASAKLVEPAPAPAPAPTPRREPITRLPNRTDGFLHAVSAGKAARKALAKDGVEFAKHGYHYAVFQSADGRTYGWRRIEAPEGPPPPPKHPRRHYRAFRTTGHRSKRAAEISAAGFLRRDRGIENPLPRRDFEVFYEGTSWGWRVLGEQADKVAATSSSSYAYQFSAARAAREYLIRNGVNDPRPFLHFRTIKHGDGRFTWEVLAQAAPAQTPKEEPAPMAQPAPTVTAEAPREPTREDRRKVMDFLDANYDADAQRWRGEWSDATAAEKLAAPRRWVADVRVQFYGDHDRNEKADQRLADVRAALARATATADKLMGYAIEADDAAKALRAEVEKLTGVAA